MLGLTLHLSWGWVGVGGIMYPLIYRLFIDIFKASMYCKKNIYILFFYLILINKFLLKTNQNVKYFLSAKERLGVVYKQKEIYRYWPKFVKKNIGYRQKYNIVHP